MEITTPDLTPGSPVLAPPEQIKPPSLLPPMQLDQGSMITVKMRGHSRTGGLDYYALALVLSQSPVRPDNQGGELEIFVLDPTAGSHYSSNYPVREISSRPSADGGVELYERASNIGQILYLPQYAGTVDDLVRRVLGLETETSAIQTETSAMQNFMMEMANSLAKLQAQVNDLTSAKVSDQKKDPGQAGAPAGGPNPAGSPACGPSQATSSAPQQVPIGTGKAK